MVEALVSQIKLVASTPAEEFTFFNEPRSSATDVTLFGTLFMGLTRLVMGFDDKGAGHRRRRRTAELGVIDSLARISDIYFSPKVVQLVVELVAAIAGAGKDVSLAQEDQEVKARFDRAVTARGSSLRRKMLPLLATAMVKAEAAEAQQ